jgi:hypothetical protein
MTIEQWFNIANIFVLPFWTLMIVLPRWTLTKQILSSFLPFIALALLYVALLVLSLTPEVAQAMANPNLPAIAGFFSEPSAAATGWVHFLVMDLFIGRWIYWEGQRLGIWTVHSLILCLFAGPLGLLSHIITAAVQERFFPASEPSEISSVS